ncbi:MAG TPA: PH domain-containing protein [Verrucomicrobiota bacterium]|nr:PH domain-containing protein [Verrucomicrobiota bacterium]
MKQNAATASRTIRVVTTVYFALTAGIFAGGFFERMLMIPVLILLLVGAYCYWFWSPVAFELEGGALTVFFRASRKTFPRVRQCVAVDETFPIGSSIRLCGNGGVFAGAGIFWNRKHGVFRAYVTRSRPDELVFVETTARKIVISPEDPQSFVRAAGPSGAE